MFSGLVSQKGEIVSLKPRGLLELSLRAQKAEELRPELGASIAVNGVCLSLTERQGEILSFELSSETQSLSNLGELRPFDKVNLEASLRMGDPIGGHLVSGHCDGLGEISVFDQTAAGLVLGVRLGPDLAPYVVKKGSIALDGISLTINEVWDRPEACEIRLMIIPITLAKTTLGQKSLGSRLNVEVDMMSRYWRREQELKSSRPLC